MNEWHFLPFYMYMYIYSASACMPFSEIHVFNIANNSFLASLLWMEHTSFWSVGKDWGLIENWWPPGSLLLSRQVRYSIFGKLRKKDKGWSLRLSGGEQNIIVGYFEKSWFDYTRCWVKKSLKRAYSLGIFVYSTK